MKTLFLATAAVAAVVAAPALAQSGPVGSVGVSYSNSEFDFGALEGEADGYALDGVVAVDAFQGWTATFAGTVGYDDDADDTALAGTAHLTRMAGSDMRFGGFVGAAEIGDETAWTVGGEIQKYLANATLTGSLAYTTADDIDIDAWTVGGDAAFYVNPNLRLNAGVAYSNVELLGTDADLWTYGVGPSTRSRIRRSRWPPASTAATSKTSPSIPGPSACATASAAVFKPAIAPARLCRTPALLGSWAPSKPSLPSKLSGGLGGDIRRGLFLSSPSRWTA